MPAARAPSMFAVALAALLAGGAACAGSGDAEPPAPAWHTVAVLGAQARFASDGSTLSAAGDAALRRLVERLAGHGELLAIRVVGHADSVGPHAYNLRLSMRRAAFVRAAIARRFPEVPLISLGAGESDPVASNATAAGRARNRRVEVHVLAIEPGGGAATPATATPVPERR